MDKYDERSAAGLEMRKQVLGAEYRTHIRGGMNNGWTSEELREMILHMSVYLGVPTALEAFRAASEVVNEKA